MDALTTLTPFERPESVAPRAGPARGRDIEGPLTFWDLLDVVNPLQHIPVVNAIYRGITGDTIKTPVKLVGATVIGGAIEFAAAMVDSIVAAAFGKDLGEHAIAMARGRERSAAETRLADVREFVPEAPASTAQVADAREFIPEPVIAAPRLASASPTEGPSDAEIAVTTVQIAAKAHVRVPAMTLAPGKFATGPAVPASERLLKMPTRRTDMPMAASAAQLKARQAMPVSVQTATAGLAPPALAAAEYRQTAAATPPSFENAFAANLDKYRALTRSRER
jgi:hypothetical protein